MRDFDIQRKIRAEADRTFMIGGEKFVRRASVRPEATQPWDDVQAETPQAETLAAMDETLLNLIEPGSRGEAHKRWKALRQREEDAITLGDMIELFQWLVGEMTGRPILPPLSSFEEPGANGTSSTDGSSLPDLQEASTA